MFEDKLKEWMLKGLEGAINLIEHLKRDKALTVEDKFIIARILSQNQVAQYLNPFFNMLKILYDNCKLQIFNEEELKRYNTCLSRLEGYSK